MGSRSPSTCQKRGFRTLLVDRGAPGGGTSYGNAGLIQREAVVLYAFPRDLPTLLRLARNRAPEARYDPRFLPRIAPFLARYWWHSRVDRHAAIARRYAPLITHALDAHRALAAEAGASDRIRAGGWVLAFRTPAARAAALADAEAVRRAYGVGFEDLDAAALGAREPHLAADRLEGGILRPDAASVDDPQGLTRAYLDHFLSLGGRFARGDAATLVPSGDAWRVLTDGGEVGAPRAVLALGPWADTVTRRLGYRLPLAVKRGYHRHYRLLGNAGLALPVLDAERGVMLAPMRMGLR
ncbi:FAD-binding oxidoreductase [Methylobacterium sp. NEAU 140]|uniref:NAD(P)/FAD-dependent oxidoreductase n=1 Tax=Methylobacterium sp. NEAU 140 TaxID=3064945 RepID=UPI002733D0E7|nr:FAD-binding oxidoreductase [Methylobacterium sp. NEAU 140]MDP4026165.1 FAD-binding oxidoreductase [Methylobacterium sp. NEAU 140]